MAVTYGFYNALNHDRLYDAIQMSSIFDGIIRDGIFSTIGDTMIVTAPEDGMYVNVGSGRAWFNHTWTLNDTDYPIEAEQAEVVLDRIDAVILEVNSSAEVRANSIKFLKGTPSSNPVKPTLTHNAEVNQYALAYVRIRAGQTTIFQSDIENAVGTDETPFITGVLQQVSIETLLKQWEAEFNTYFTNFQNTSTTEFNNWLATKVSEYTAWFAQMQTDMDSNFNEFDAWFQRMKDQLSQDAAGHLQAQIDALSEAAKKGSVVTVTTTDPTLFGKNVTISKTGFDPVTSSFNSAGVAYFETVPMVGDVSIEATNGTLTAHGSINIPYFGRYSTTLEFWEAILDISTDIESLYNRQITVTKNNSTVGTTTFDSTGHATFSVHSVGTYHVSATDSLNKTYEADVEVTEETTYTVEFIDVINGATVEPTDNITTWLKCANIEDPSITTLADVLANRTLFETLIANSNACNYMARSTTWALAEGLVPKMTSNTEPSGVVTSSGNDSANNPSWLPYNVFNEDITEGWWASTGTNAYISYQSVKPICVKKISVQSILKNNYIRLKNFKLQGSNDGSNWTDIYSGVYENNDRTQIFSFANDNFYSYHKLYCIDNYATSTGLTDYNIVIRNLQFYSNVDITTSQDAMSLIGKYDYCSNALLSNATWAEAIGKSEYFEEVLNVSVPKMTSNTEPSGVCSASSVQSGYPAWKSFNGDAISVQGWTSTQTTNAWIEYDFGKEVKVNAINIVPFIDDSKKYRVKDFIVQAYDGNDWINIYEDTIPNATTVTEYFYYFENNESYSKYRLLVKNNYATDGGYIIVNELQFYGRASAQTNIIHSAANDTIYMMKDGSEVVLTTTDSNGVGTLDFTQFDDGVTYTLYSSVAKDPNNLSNDYSKNIRITKSKYGCTTEAYLMPDPVKTLYWYGYKGSNYQKGNAIQINLASGSISENTNNITLTYNEQTIGFGHIGCALTKTMDISGFNKMCGIASAYTYNPNKNEGKGYHLTATPLTGINTGGPSVYGYTGTSPSTMAAIAFNQDGTLEKQETDISNYNSGSIGIVLVVNGGPYTSTFYALWLE